MVLKNPAVLFCRTKDPVKVVRFLEKMNKQIGWFTDSDDNHVELMLISEGEAETYNPDVGRIHRVHRGRLVREEKDEIPTRPPRITKTYYPYSYYGIESTRGNFMLFCAKRKAAYQILHLLRANSFAITRVTMDRSVQNKLVGRRDMFYYQTSVEDETEARAGKIILTSPNTDTSLEGADIERLIDKRGRPRNLGITWRETNIRPKVVFKVFRDGRMNIKRMIIDEVFFLELVDIVIGVL